VFFAPSTPRWPFGLDARSLQAAPVLRHVNIVGDTANPEAGHDLTYQARRSSAARAAADALFGDGRRRTRARGIRT
jgi:hypothetical protein